LNSKLRLSVVMPSFNHARYIREAIDSVLNQDYPLVDLLVMDGGSTDSTVDILKSYGDRLQFISQKDKGQSDAINQGFRIARGDVLSWLNSDDFFSPGAVSKVMGVFKQNEGIDWIYGDGCIVDEKGQYMFDSGVLPFSLWKIIHHRNFIHQPSCFFRKSLIEKVGPLDESLHYVMDWELWIRFGVYKNKYIKEMLSSNRTYPQNKTESGHFRRWLEIYRVVRRYTNEKMPPIIVLYFMEIIVQILRSGKVPNSLVRPLALAFEKGMMRELSGHYPDGGIKSRFCFSVGNPKEMDNANISILPISAIDPRRVGGPPIRIRWSSSTRQFGYMIVEENGKEQTFNLPLGPRNGVLYVHFHCSTLTPTSAMPNEWADSRKLIGFLKLP
jgi:glycosyltransferase involved in cell wall biosynthesis